MPAWSPEIANEFIRLANGDNLSLTHMQLQKLVYIANGWNLAINGEALTYDEPKAWDFGPVYSELWNALRQYGRSPVARLIRNREYIPGAFDDEPDADATRELSDAERAVIKRVYRDYGKFPAFQLSALTHREGTPWTQIYKNGEGKFDEIPNGLIREHFVELAAKPAANNA
jgi:uncharacterized phage-associated protein